MEEMAFPKALSVVFAHTSFQALLVNGKTAADRRR
jgi:hypothetical protein